VLNPLNPLSMLKKMPVAPRERAPAVDKEI
jgi:hypothetical protein